MFFISWGTKRVTKQVGYVADFCPICRRTSQFVLNRLGMASHVYGISVGSGKLAGHLKTCTSCKVVTGADPSIYSSVCPTNRRSIGDIVTETFPNISEFYAKRFELEERLSTGTSSLDPSERIPLIREPFLLLSPLVETKYEEKIYDLPVVAAIAFTIIGPFVAAKVFSELLPTSTDAFLWAAVSTLAIGLVITIIQAFLSTGRFLSKAVFPRIASTLRLLAPTDTEIIQVMGELRMQGHKIGKKANERRMIAANQSALSSVAG